MSEESTPTKGKVCGCIVLEGSDPRCPYHPHKPELADLRAQLDAVTQERDEASTKLEVELIRETCSQCNHSWSPSLVESGWCIFCIHREAKAELAEARQQLAAQASELRTAQNVITVLKDERDELRAAIVGGGSALLL